MTGTQSGIMWLGLLLIIVRLFTTEQGAQLWSMITTGGNVAASSTATKTSGKTGSSSSGESGVERDVIGGAGDVGTALGGLGSGF
jgi:hypothetical protein